jgi:hypothetical protein
VSGGHRRSRAVACALFLVALTLPGSAAAQVLLDVYLGQGPGSLRDQIQKIAVVAPGQRDEGLIRNLLPHSDPIRFAEMRLSTGALDAALADLDARLLNKMVGNPPGTNGTSLVSKAAAPRVLAAAVEYGNVLQQTSGTTTTLRANLLGLGRTLVGYRQLRVCPIDGSCGLVARALRAVSGTVAFETVKAPVSTVPVAAGGTVSTAQLLGDDYRVSSWGARLDLTSKDDLQAPRYMQAWRAAHAKLQSDPTLAALSKEGTAVVQRFTTLPMYVRWQGETTTLLQEADDEAAMHAVLQRQLDELVDAIDDSDPEFAASFSTSLVALVRANVQFTEARDALLREMHAHRFSVEYTNQKPTDQPSTSNVRLIYSHQPTFARAVFTLNGAASWYNTRPTGTDTSRFRDVQLAGQIDRRLGEFGLLGDGVLSLAGYYQWMKDDAVVTLGPGNVAPNSTIVLPDGAAEVLGTQGHIGVAQVRFSLSLNSVVRVPLSVTWATRRELINENDVRGQVGLTLDLDQVLR